MDVGSMPELTLAEMTKAGADAGVKILPETYSYDAIEGSDTLQMVAITAGLVYGAPPGIPAIPFCRSMTTMAVRFGSSFKSLIAESLPPPAGFPSPDRWERFRAAPPATASRTMQRPTEPPIR